MTARYLTANSNILVPDRDLHSRYFASDITAYDYETVIATMEEMEILYREYANLLNVASALIRPHDQYPGDIAYAPEYIQKLDKAACIEVPTFCNGNTKRGGRQEQYPISIWQKQMGTYRRAIKSLKKALDDCPQEPQPEAQEIPLQGVASFFEEQQHAEDVWQEQEEIQFAEKQERFHVQSVTRPEMKEEYFHQEEETFWMICDASGTPVSDRTYGNTHGDPCFAQQERNSLNKLARFAIGDRVIVLPEAGDLRVGDIAIVLQEFITMYPCPTVQYEVRFEEESRYSNSINQVYFSQCLARIDTPPPHITPMDMAIRTEVQDLEDALLLVAPIYEPIDSEQEPQNSSSILYTIITDHLDTFTRMGFPIRYLLPDATTPALFHSSHSSESSLAFLAKYPDARIVSPEQLEAEAQKREKEYWEKQPLQGEGEGLDNPGYECVDTDDLQVGDIVRLLVTVKGQVRWVDSEIASIQKAKGTDHMSIRVWYGEHAKSEWTQPYTMLRHQSIDRRKPVEL